MPVFFTLDLWVIVNRLWRVYQYLRNCLCPCAYSGGEGQSFHQILKDVLGPKDKEPPISARLAWLSGWAEPMNQVTVQFLVRAYSWVVSLISSEGQAGQLINNSLPSLVFLSPIFPFLSEIIIYICFKVELKNQQYPFLMYVSYKFTEGRSTPFS